MKPIKVLKSLPKKSVHLIFADAPYNIGKDFGNDSDKLSLDKFVSIIDSELQKILSNGLDKESLIALLNHNYS